MRNLILKIFILLIVLSSPLFSITLTGNFINPENNCSIEFKQGRLRIIMLGISNSWFKYEKQGNSIWVIKGGAGGGDLELTIVNDTIVINPSFETLMIDGTYYKEGSSILLKKLEDKKKEEVNKIDDSQESDSSDDSEKNENMDEQNNPDKSESEKTGE